MKLRLRSHPSRLLVSLCAVAVLTFLAHKIIPINATTVGFAYLLLVLVIASAWGFLEAAVSSFAATLVFNFFFFPPIGTFTIADPQNWVALFSFLATSLIASRLSAKAKARAREATERQQDVERLYEFSREMLLTDRTVPLGKQLTEKIAEIFGFDAVALHEFRSAETYHAGSSTPVGIEGELRRAASSLNAFSPTKGWIVLSASLGSEPFASIAVRGVDKPATVLQGIANLVAICIERARADDLAREIEAARRSEQLRRTLIDAMAHEFKTPLTLIKGATTSLLAGTNQAPESRMEQLRIADEEAEHLRRLIDDAIEMARLDTERIEINPEISDLKQTVNEVLESMQTEIDDHPIRLSCNDKLPPLIYDRRLIKLAIKQLLDNALKYSPPETEVEIGVHANDVFLDFEVTDHGKGIAVAEQSQIFERFYRSASVRDQIPGSGLGLSIAHSIIKAHGGELTVASEPGHTTFRITLPLNRRKEIA